MLNDSDGQTTLAIKNDTSLPNSGSKRDSMLTSFLALPNPTWRKVVKALEDGNYPNVAAKIKQDLNK